MRNVELLSTRDCEAGYGPDCRAYPCVYCSLKLVNFELMLNCFGPVWSRENIIGSVRGRGHKIYYFLVRSGVLRGRGAKNLAPQDSSWNCILTWFLSFTGVTPTTHLNWLSWHQIVVFNQSAMSLFKARDWWGASVGSDEVFDQGSLCVANIDNNSTPYGKSESLWFQLQVQ